MYGNVLPKRYRHLSLSILLFVLLAWVVTACGGQTTATPANGGDQAESQDGKRLIKHAMGETWVPAKPQRVIVMDSGELDNVLALGVMPVGATFYTDKDEPLLSYAQEKTNKITLVGSLTQPNLETISSLEPDLILSSKIRHEKIYKELSDIAPTVFTESVGVSWKENLKVHAEALNKTKEAEQLMQKYYQRLAEFKEKLSAKGPIPEISVLRIYPDHTRVYMKASFSGTILEDAGLKRPAFSNKDEFAGEVSFEKIKDMDADVIFITQYGIKSQARDDLIKRPQWQTLKATQSQKVFTVSDHIWIRGIGIGGAQLLVEDLYKYLLG